ncbi:MAG TPA: 50S ribosomal protein L9 [Candidatus Omnitrophota bacterium]|nr:50S ribosomal protein L9 [Candidatus Omnitrophota bacterium]
MEVILKQDTDKLGKAGSIVNVKDGFARNFLIPNGMAAPVTAVSLKKLQQDKENKALQQDKAKKECEALKEKLERLSLTIPVLTHDEDKLYANITNQDIASALKDEGIELDKDTITQDEPIKALGIYEVPVRLHPEVLSKIKVWIVKK